MDDTHFEIPVSKAEISAHRSALGLAARLSFEALKLRGHKVSELLEMSASIASIRMEQMEQQTGMSLVVRVNKKEEISNKLMQLIEEEPRIIPLLYYALSPPEGEILRA